MKYLFLVTIVIFILGVHSALSCKTDLECNFGICSQSSSCVCKKSYINYNNASCIYKQKSKLSAFLLSFLLGPFGADWFYLANGNLNYILIGLGKLTTGFGICITACCACCMRLAFGNSDKEVTFKTAAALGIFYTCLPVLCSATATVWYIVDWVRILSDAFPDGKNVALDEW